MPHPENVGDTAGSLGAPSLPPLIARGNGDVCAPCAPGDDAAAPAAAAAAASSSAGANAGKKGDGNKRPPIPAYPGRPPPKRRRMCRFPGCPRVIQSQGHCQTHGAKAPTCNADGCTRKKQGGLGGFCISHYKEKNGLAKPEKEKEVPPEPEGESVWDDIIPRSVRWKHHKKNCDAGNKEMMPLVAFFKDGATKERGWHRIAERRAQGKFPKKTQFEDWERELIMFESLLIAGTPGQSMSNFEHAWGHTAMWKRFTEDFVERRGSTQRKQRPEKGTKWSDDKRAAFKKSLQERKKEKAEAAAQLMEVKAGGVQNGEGADVQVPPKGKTEEKDGARNDGDAKSKKASAILARKQGRRRKPSSSHG